MILLLIVQCIQKSIMKSQSQFLSNGRSLFSLNTLNTVQPNSSNPNNQLHQFYQKLMGQQNYPYLCKILFLQLVLRQNVLIYSNRRVEIKQVWNSINKKIGEKIGNIYLIDQLTKIQQILANKSQYKRVLIYDLTEMSNGCLNYLLNHQEETVTLTVIQNTGKVIRPQLTDLFPFVFHYDGQSESMDLLDTKDKKKQEKFEKDKFYECVTYNFNQTLEAKQQQGFLKVYLALLREKSASLNIPYSRWKKMIKVLHFIGLTKTQKSYKRLSLSDCLFAPECLGRTCPEIESLKRANQQAIMMLLPYFGTYKWLKQLSSHFWLSNSTKQYFTSLAQKLRGKVSFFYPCSKFPQTVKLLYQDSFIFYRVTGFDKKLMSDKYFEISQGKQYVFQAKYRSDSPAFIHFGVACYDQDKSIINPVQVCRYENTAVTITSIESNKIICRAQDVEVLKNWKNINSFGYEKCMGIYLNGEIDRLLNNEQVLYCESDSYSKQQNSGIYKSIENQIIQLTDNGIKLFNKLKNRIVLGVTQLMNHYEGGTYVIFYSQIQKQQKWKQININIKGNTRTNSGNQFLLETKYIRIVIMPNYNGGYPDFKIHNKMANVDIKDISWMKV